MKVRKGERQTPAEPANALQRRFGAEIRARRLRLGVTQEELAWRANLHRTYLADIERGGRNPTLRIIAKLAQALDVTAGGLLPNSRPRLGADAIDRETEIVLIGDNPNRADRVLRALRRARLANPVKQVQDGQEALEYVFCTGVYQRKTLAGRTRLGLLDLNSPGVSWLDVVRQIKHRSGALGIPVAVLCASRPGLHATAGCEWSAENYIIKFCNPTGSRERTPRSQLVLMPA